jgi:hypothetical protein
MTIHEDLKGMFGPADSPHIHQIYIQDMLRNAWQERLNNVGLRAHCWRVLLGLVSHSDKSVWKSQLQSMVGKYTVLKESVLPSIAKVKADPLSALSTGETVSDEWNAFYKHVELTDFIKGDLDRLYLSGVEDDYFQSKQRRDLVLNILFIWSAENLEISYRQGMHEIVGCLLFIVENELQYWQEAEVRGEVSPDHYLSGCFTAISVEAYTYMLFERIMLELASLYDPLPVYDGQPFVVQFCSKIQGLCRVDSVCLTLLPHNGCLISIV